MFLVSNVSLFVFSNHVFTNNTPIKGVTIYEEVKVSLVYISAVTVIWHYNLIGYFSNSMFVTKEVERVW